MNCDANEIIFDWDRDRVLRGTVQTRITGQQKALLRLLVDRETTVSPREFLLDCIWGERAPYVDELYLVQLVYRLRKSLTAVGLDRCIVTVPRRGYRFVPLAQTGRPEVERMAEASPASRSESRAACAHALGYLLSRLGAAPAEAPLTASVFIADHGLHLDESHGVVTYGQVVARLTRLELRLLAALTQHPDTVLPKHEIIASVWGEHVMIDENSLTQLVSRLRRALLPLGLDCCVAVAPKVGYQFDCTRVAATACSW